MLSMKTPTYSLPGSSVVHCSVPHTLIFYLFFAVAKLFANRIWFRSQARVEQTLITDASPGILAACPAPAARLPHEIVEIIIGHLTYDRLSLLVCSQTCRSWYIASVPHLHHTIVTCPWTRAFQPKREWPEPLQHASKLGLLPLVKKLLVHNSPCVYFSPKQLTHNILCQFSRLTNIQQFEITGLNIPSFTHGVRQYFSHFLPTLRSLSLGSPRGSRRQIVFFIGLFQHLEDLTLFDCPWTREPDNDLPSIPPFAPPLRGRLLISQVREKGLLEDMVHLFGGIRFGYMHIFDVDGTLLLPRACANTLETLQLNPNDPRGEQPHPKCA
jgi:hypothetical protein